VLEAIIGAAVHLSRIGVRIVTDLKELGSYLY
jgi:hypothetical protein